MKKNKAGGAEGEVRVPSVKEIMQEFAQQAAVASQEVEAPVVATTDARAFLPTGFDYVHNDNAVIITFRANVKGLDSESYKITLEEIVVRRWLQGLYGIFKTAGWRLDIWPEWISDATPPSAVEAPQVIRH